MSDSASTAGSTSGAEPSGGSQRRTTQQNLTNLKRHCLAHKFDVLLWIVRAMLILFAVGYFFPIYWSSQNCYYKILIANAAINALRLHQRLNNVRLSREFLAELISEDSCHYLFYSLIFIYVAPVTLVILPLVLFSILHVASYSLTILDILGQNSWWGARLAISLVEFQSLNILRLIAFTEIILMPFTVLLVLLGRASLLTPFIYYHFLTQRYTSRRNPYNRTMFHELRLLLEKTAARPKLPNFAKASLLGIVQFTLRLAPPVPAPRQSQ